MTPTRRQPPTPTPSKGEDDDLGLGAELESIDTEIKLGERVERRKRVWDQLLGTGAEVPKPSAP